MDTISADVILCTFNSEKYISACLLSILPQLTDSINLVIIDDASTDSTLQIISDTIAASKSTKEIKIFSNKTNQGLTRNLINSIACSTADYIIRIDSDDICCIDRFAKQINYAISHPQVDIIGGQAVLINSAGLKTGYKLKPLSDSDIKNQLYLNPFVHSTVIFKRSSINRVGGYNSSLRHGQDYELWFRCAKYGLKMVNLPEPLVYLRISKRSKYSISTYLTELKIGFIGSWQCHLRLVAYFRIIARFLYCVVEITLEDLRSLVLLMR
jgi:amylovoran biosynthesis glycosyltransferase AmsE